MQEMQDLQKIPASVTAPPSFSEVSFACKLPLYPHANLVAQTFVFLLRLWGREQFYFGAWCRQVIR